MTRDSTTNRNWLGERWTPAETHAPRDHHELRRILERAVAERAKVGILGRGFSCAPGYRTKGVQIVTTRLDRIGEFDPGTSTIEVGAGTTVRALNACLRARGIDYGLVSVSTLDQATLGGLVANGCHGSDPSYGALADQVVAMHMLVRVGESIRRIRVSPENEPARWPYLLGALGLCGVVDSLTLRLEPLYHVEVRATKRTIDDVFDARDPSKLARLAMADGQLLITYLPFADGLMVKTMKRTDAPATPYGPRDRMAWNASPYVNRLCTRTMRRVPSLTPALNRAFHRGIPDESSVRRLTEAVHANDRQSDFPCAMSAFAIRADADCANVVLAFRTMLEVLEARAARGAYPINACINTRFAGASTLPLSPLHGRKGERFFVVDLLSYVGTPGYDDAVRAIVRAWRDRGLVAKPFWAKLGPSILGPHALREVYGEALGEFLALRQAMDESGMFLTEHHAKLFGLDRAAAPVPTLSLHGGLA